MVSRASRRSKWKSEWEEVELLSVVIEIEEEQEDEGLCGRKCGYIYMAFGESRERERGRCT